VKLQSETLLLVCMHIVCHQFILDLILKPVSIVYIISRPMTYWTDLLPAGEALAKEYACLGAKLILSSRRPSELERVKSELVGKRVASELLENEFHSKSSVLVHGPCTKHWDFYVSL
jgi:hypothetical protein